MTTKLFLLKFEADCMDEFDVYGLAVMTELQMDEYFKVFQIYFKSSGTFNLFVGTNASIDFDDFKAFKRAFTIKEIDDTQCKSLISLGLAWYGHLPDLDDLEFEEEEESEEESSEED